MKNQHKENYSNLTQSAIDYQSEGFNPLPLKNNKAPLLGAGHPYLYEPIDKLESRFAHAEKIGIACGEVSGGFYCLDFDKHKGQDIEPIFEDFLNTSGIQFLIKEGGLSVYKTPSGGYHFYFKYDFETLTGSVPSRWLDGSTMIEIRGNGQYVACYPSEGYHYIKGVEIVKLNYIDKETKEWLIEIVRSFTLEEVQPTQYNTSDRKWKGEWDNSTVDGRFNNESADEARQLLIDEGWTVSGYRRDGVEYWTRPGKSHQDGISATWGKRKNMFYVFSSNAQPFQNQTAYTPFQIYTLLKFAGDWKEAKQSLMPPVDVKEEPNEISKVSLFPIDVFPKFIQDYIIELNRTLNFHPDFTASAAMYAFATVNGNKFKLKVKKGWQSPTIFWFACVGYPGAIKTHPVKTMIDPLYRIDKVNKEFYDAEMAHYDPDAKPKQPKPKFKQLLVSDYTIEALHHIHDINKKGIGLYKDELVGFLNDMNKYRKGSDEQFWLESFNNHTYTVNRVTKEPLMISDICINIIGTIQHDVLHKIVTDYKGNGMIDRFLFTSSEDKVYPLNEHEIEDEFGDFWFKVIQKMNTSWFYAKTDDTQIVKMTNEAFKVYQQIDQSYVDIQNSEEESQDIKNYLSKMKTYVPRFALLLAIMESVFDNSYITVNDTHMTNAGRLAEYFIGTARSVFEATASSSDVKNILMSMKGKTRDEQIFELYRRQFKMAQISKHFGLSKMQCYRIIKKMAENKK
jgi:hypothetical protein